MDNVLEPEIWKVLPESEGKYFVSNRARIKHRNGFYLKPNQRQVYDSVCLSINGKDKRYFIHRLVAFLFVPNPENKKIVNHKDRNKRNNYYKNLEWVTLKENNEHALRTPNPNKNNNPYHLTTEDLINEQWMDIKGLEGYYQVSNMGRVRSLDRVVFNRGLGIYDKKKGIILKVSGNHNTYHFVRLATSDKKKNFAVHRLVLSTFGTEPPFENAVCRHMNNIPSDNRLTNLKWGTRSDNMQDCIKSGRFYHNTTGNFGAANSKSILVKQFSLDGELIKIHYGITEAARNTGFHYAHIRRAILDKRPTHGFAFTFGDAKAPKIRPIKALNTRSKTVYQYDSNGNLVNIFPKVADAARALNTSTTKISSCCYKKRKTHLGFIFSFGA